MPKEFIEYVIEVIVVCGTAIGTAFYLVHSLGKKTKAEI